MRKGLADRTLRKFSNLITGRVRELSLEGLIGKRAGSKYDSKRSGAHHGYVAVPEGRAEVSVRSFGADTAQLDELAQWLKDCAITTVALESTGVYWVSLYQELEEAGFEVLLVDAHQVKHVPDGWHRLAAVLAAGNAHGSSALLEGDASRGACPVAGYCDC
jgi:hypothetical protein